MWQRREQYDDGSPQQQQGQAWNAIKKSHKEQLYGGFQAAA
jgi:hypothetical protein